MAAQSWSEAETRQVTWIILNAVDLLQVGKIKLAQFLKGSKSKCVKSISGNAVYGGLMWFDISTITGFIDQLERMGLIHRKIISGYPRDYPVLALTEAGKLVLEEKKQIPLQVIKQSQPANVGDSERKTLELLSQGKNASQIAQERNLALSTVYTHFFRLISNDYLSSSDVISEEIIRKVTDATKNWSNLSVKQVKDLLPELGYDEIRCALAGISKRDSQ